MGKPRIFLGSSGKQVKLLQALTRGLNDIAHETRAGHAFSGGLNGASTRTNAGIVVNKLLPLLALRILANLKEVSCDLGYV